MAKTMDGPSGTPTVGSNKFVIGSETVVLCNPNVTGLSSTEFKVYKYQPQSVYKTATTSSGLLGPSSTAGLNPPIVQAVWRKPTGATGATDVVYVEEDIKTKSLVFIYENENDEDKVAVSAT